MTDIVERLENADWAAKIQQAMEAKIKSDPLRAAIMNAICNSTDPRVTAVRRKCSFDQLRTLTNCVATAVEAVKEPKP